MVPVTLSESLPGSLPAVVTTPRFRLVLIGVDEARSMLAGGRQPSWHPDYPRRDDLDGLSLAGPEEHPWRRRHIVRIVGDLTIGSIGFFGLPEPAADGVPEAEVGYGLVAEARDRGVASEVLRALLEHTDAAGVRVRARTAPDDRAGVRVLAKAGFTELRGADEDGHLVMARPLRS